MARHSYKAWFHTLCQFSYIIKAAYEQEDAKVRQFTKIEKKREQKEKNVKNRNSSLTQKCSSNAKVSDRNIPLKTFFSFF